MDLSSESSDDSDEADEIEEDIASLNLHWWQDKYSDSTISPALYTARNFGLNELIVEGMYVAERNKNI